MIAGSRRLFYPRLALGQQAGEQQTRFHLRTGDRHLVLDGEQRAARASDAQRRQTSRLRIYAGSHLLQRRDDALHGALGERLVASHLAAELLAGKNTRQHAHGGTGVATIQRLGRNLEALTAPGDFQHAVSLRHGTAKRAEATQCAGAIGAGRKIFKSAGALRQRRQHGIAM